MNAIAFLIIAVSIFALALVLFLIPEKKCSLIQPKCNSGNKPTCVDGEWKCDINVLLPNTNLFCHSKKPICDDGKAAICLNGQWICIPHIEKDYLASCCDPREIPNCSGQKLCINGTWKCVSRIPNKLPRGKCNPRTKSLCSDGSEPTCINGSWQCNDYNIVSPDVNSIKIQNETCYPTDFNNEILIDNIESLQDAEQQCQSAGDDCKFFQYDDQSKSMKYISRGVPNDNITTGYRMLPYSSNVFNRDVGYDNSSKFQNIDGSPSYIRTSHYNVSDIDKCEGRCINFPACGSASPCNCSAGAASVGGSGAFGYTYDSASDASTNCTCYSALQTSDTQKYIKS